MTHLLPESVNNTAELAVSEKLYCPWPQSCSLLGSTHLVNKEPALFPPDHQSDIPGGRGQHPSSLLPGVCWHSLTRTSWTLKKHNRSQRQVTTRALWWLSDVTPLMASITLSRPSLPPAQQMAHLSTLWNTTWRPPYNHDCGSQARVWSSHKYILQSKGLTCPVEGKGSVSSCEQLLLSWTKWQVATAVCFQSFQTFRPLLHFWSLIPTHPPPSPSMLTLLEALHSTVGSVRADARRNQKHVTGAVAGSHSADCGKAQWMHTHCSKQQKPN